MPQGFGRTTSEQPSESPQNEPWKIIIVDDDPSVHELTAIVLRNLTYLNRRLHFVNVYSAEEAKEVCQQTPEAALILLDVVLEAEDSGLKLVQYIREQLKNDVIRIVLRTGQAGRTPEKDIIVHYDINDYKEKTELTSTKLYTTIIASLRSYKEIIDRQKAEQTLRIRKDRLRKHNQILAELTKNKLFTIGNLNTALKTITKAAAEALDVQYVSVWAYDTDKKHFHTLERYSADQHEHDHSQIWNSSHSTEYFRYFNETQVIAFHDPESILKYKQYAPPYHSDNPVAVLEAPMRLHQDIAGFIRFEHVNDLREWTIEDENFSATMSDFVSAALSNIEHEKQLREKIRMESELQTAAAVQKALFPKELPHIPQMELASYFQSASETGGDWYNFMTCFEDHLFILIGDVTGHGTPAALVTATASATCRALEDMYYAQNLIPSPAQLLTHLNKAIYETGHPDYSMTFFIASINLKTKILTFSNAAHNFPCLIRTEGTFKYLLNRQNHLGFQLEQQFTNAHLSLKAGDLLIFYTDGLIENTNPEGQMYSNPKFRRTLKRYATLPPQQMINRIIQELHQFYKNTPLLDDMTLVAGRIL